MDATPALQAVRGLWSAYQARDWAGAEALLAPQACSTWWASGERFVGGAAVVHVNAVYPEGWQIHLLAVEPLTNGRALSLVRVDQDGVSYYAHSWFRFTDESPPRIAAIDEFWADAAPPPAWREGLPGRQRLAMPCGPDDL